MIAGGCCRYTQQKTNLLSAFAGISIHTSGSVYYIYWLGPAVSSASNLQGFGTEKITTVESLQQIIAEMETTETTGRASADCPSSVSMRSDA
jgi:hypothetical protein